MRCIHIYIYININIFVHVIHTRDMRDPGRVEAAARFRDFRRAGLCLRLLGSDARSPTTNGFGFKEGLGFRV